MLIARHPIIGSGKFQWNAGGWFGGSIGSSAWMIVAAGSMLLNNQPLVAMIPALGFAVILIASLLLWSRRDRIYPFTAMMALLGLFALILPLVWILIHVYGSAQSRAAMNWPDSLWSLMPVFALVPALMTWFLILEHTAIGRCSSSLTDY